MNNYRADFPIFSSKDVAYLDNAATTQRPRSVISAMRDYAENKHSNPHRGAYELSNLATEEYEHARQNVADFINAQYEEIVFTSGSTGALNILALSYGMQNVNNSDEILITISEHHSNLLPWQSIAKMKGAKLNYVYLNDDYTLNLQEFRDKITEKTKIVSVAYISNVLGIENPIEEIVKIAHEKGAVVVVDAAQAAPHIKIDVAKLDVDFLTFSGHKMLAPTGIGVLYGKKHLLDKTNPAFLGGGIVEKVEEQSAVLMDTPYKFESGTPKIEGAVGLSAAIDYIKNIGFENIEKTVYELSKYAFAELSKLPFVDLYLKEANKAGIISFNVKDIHPHDTSTILDAYSVAIRAGHHCAQPLLAYLGVSSTCRMSIYFYNTKEDIDRAVEAIKQVRGVLGFAN